VVQIFESFFSNDIGELEKTVQIFELLAHNWMG